MIRIRELEFRYPRSEFRLQIDSLEIGSGELVGIIGPSGCGKSTLLHLIAAIQSPDRGSIEVLGYDLKTLSESARRQFRQASIGFVFQAFELFDYLNVRDNILLPFRMAPGRKVTPEVTRSLETLAMQTNIQGKLHQRIDRLSQGEKQRVAICRALLPQPKLVLADEPTGNLDPLAKQSVLDLLIEAVRSSGASLVLVTHDHALLPKLDRVLELEAYTQHSAARLKP